MLIYDGMLVSSVCYLATITRCGGQLTLATNMPIVYIDGLVQNCSISSVLAMEKLQSCIEPWKTYMIACQCLVYVTSPQ